MSEDNKATLKKANAAITDGDIEGFLAFCTDDTEWTTVGEGTLQGKDAVRQWMKQVYLAPPKFDVANLIAEGDFVTAYGHITVTDRDGKATHSQYCDVWRFRGGKMAELRAYVIETGAK